MTEAALHQPRNSASKLQIFIVITLQVILLLGLTAWAFGLRPVQNWEYKIESPSDLSFESTINLRGAEGWELVTARRATSRSENESAASYEMIFKRPLKAKT